MTKLFIILGLIAVANALLPLSNLLDSLSFQRSARWLKFKANHNKSYGNATEEKRRYEIYEANYKYIDEHNGRFEKGESTYYLRLDQYSDCDKSERAAALLTVFPNYISSAISNINSTVNFISDALIGEPKHRTRRDTLSAYGKAPDSFDYRTTGAVGPVKNQGNCVVCWAFAVNVAVEAMNFKRTGKLQPLSEQDMVDCEHSGKCSGNSLKLPLDYILKNGIMYQKDYPYTGAGTTCKYDKTKKSDTQMNGVWEIPNGQQLNETSLKSFIAYVLPMPIGISVDSDLQSYAGGIFNNPACNKIRMNHAVCLIGYGIDKGQDYWLIKNSWGPKWGENGYFRIARGVSQCNIGKYAAYPY